MNLFRKTLVVVVPKLPVPAQLKGKLLCSLISSDVRYWAIGALARLRLPSKHFAGYLRTILSRCPDSSLCQHAIHAFAELPFPSEETVEILAPAVVRDYHIRSTAIEALAALGDPGINRLLQMSFDADDCDVRRNIIENLTMESLMEVLSRHPGAPERKEAAEKLGCSYSPPGKLDVNLAVPALVNAIKNDSNEDVRDQAAYSLNSSIYGEAGMAALVELAGEPNPKARLSVVRGLPLRGCEDLLDRLSEDLDTDVRIAAQVKITRRQREDTREEEEQKKKAAEKEKKAAQIIDVGAKYPMLQTLESASLSDIAAFLVSMLDDAWAKGSPDIYMDEAVACRLVGEELARRNAMRQVIETMLGRHNSSRCLDVWWDGIGGWRG